MATDLPWDKLCKFESRALRKSKGGALLVEIDSEEIWVPKSVIDDKSEVWVEGDIGELVIPL